MNAKTLPANMTRRFSRALQPTNASKSRRLRKRAGVGEELSPPSPVQISDFVTRRERSGAARDATRAKQAETKPVHHRSAPGQLTGDYGFKRGRGIAVITELRGRDEDDVFRFEQHLTRSTKNTRPATVTNYLHATKQFMTFARLRHWPAASECSKAQINQWLNVLRDGDPDWSPPMPRYSPYTVLNRYLGLRAFFKFLAAEAREEELEFTDPMAGISRPEVPEDTDKPIATREELKRLFADLRAKKRWRDLAACCVLYDTGMRASELANLRREDIHHTGLAFIRSTSTGNKAREPRPVGLTPPTMKWLRRYWTETPPRYAPEYAFNNFNGRNGGQLTREGVYDIVKCAWQGVGINHLGPHSFRHTMATHHIEEGDLSETELRDVLGQKSTKPLEGYIKKRRKQTAAEKLARGGSGVDSILNPKKKE